MNPRPITGADLEWWGPGSRPARYTGPDEVDADIEPCPAVQSPARDGFGEMVHVPWTLDEIELAHLAQGGTLWLTTWGSLPIHSLQVQAP